MKLSFGKKITAIILAYLIAIIPMAVIFTGCGGGAGGGASSPASSSNSANQDSPPNASSYTVPSSPNPSTTPSAENPASNDPIAQNEQVRQNSEILISRYGPFVRTNTDGTYRIDIDSQTLQQIGGNTQELQQVVETIRSTNQIITSDESSRYRHINSRWYDHPSGLKYQIKWYGIEVYIPHESVEDLTLLAGIGGGISSSLGWSTAFLSWIHRHDMLANVYNNVEISLFTVGDAVIATYGIYAGVLLLAAGVLGISMAIIMKETDNGQGVILHFIWGAMPFWMTSAPENIDESDSAFPGIGTAIAAGTGSSSTSSGGGSSSSSSSSGGVPNDVYANIGNGSSNPEAFKRCWMRNNGGWIPFNNGGGSQVHRWSNADVLDVKKEGYHGRGIMVLADGASKAYLVYGYILDWWQNPDKVGWPTSDQLPAGRSPFGTEGWYQDFDRGKAYDSRFGVVFLSNTVSAKHDAEGGGTNGPLGFPIRRKQTTSPSPYSGVVADYYDFEGGQIYSSVYGTFAIYGEENNLYNNILFPTGSNSVLGLFTSDMLVAGISPYGTESYYRNTENNGQIYQSRFGTFYLAGVLCQKYNSTNPGGTNGYIGVIIGNPKSITSIFGTSGDCVKGEGGEIQSSRFGTFVIYQEFARYLYNLNSVAASTKFGFATSDPYDYVGCIKAQNYEGGTLYLYLDATVSENPPPIITPSPTATPTINPTSTPTATTNTPTTTPTVTFTPPGTPTITPTVTPTSTPTMTLYTPTSTPSPTTFPPTGTPTVTPTATPTVIPTGAITGKGVIQGEVLYIYTLVPMEGVDVHITNLATGSIYDRVTDSHGKYQIELPVGNYSVTFAKEGYKTCNFYPYASVQNQQVILLNIVLFRIPSQGKGDMFFQVRDSAYNYDLLQYANVTVLGISTLTTNRRGIVGFCDLSEGIYQYTITLAGYRNVTGEFHIKLENTCGANISLQRE